MKAKITLFLAAIMVSLALGSYGAMSAEIQGHGGYDDMQLVIDLKNVSTCGDGLCGTDEYCGSCPEDCGKCMQIDIKWPYKYTVDMSKFIEKEPGAEIGVVIVPKEGIQTQGMIDWICVFCKICNWFCDSLLPILKENGFKPLAVTSEGYIVGTIKAENVEKVASMDTVLLILPDDGISTKLGGIDLKIEPLILDINTKGGIDMDTKESVVIPIGGETQIGDVKLRVDREPYRFLGIPIFWLESDSLRLEIDEDGRKETNIIKNGSSIPIGDKLVEISNLRGDKVKISSHGL